MTTTDLPSDVSAALVYAERPPDLADERFVDVRPGFAASFDGSRFHVPIHVTGPAGRRGIYDNREVAAIASAARSHLRGGDVAYLRLDDRARPRDPWWAETVGAIERRLAAAARREGATLLTWTDADRRSADEERYDVVISR